MFNSALEKMEHLSRKNLEQVLERFFRRDGYQKALLIVAQLAK